MSATERTSHLDLSQTELRILVQSLANCIATCQKKSVKPDAPCEDCDAARDLQEKLEKNLKS